MEMTQNVTHCRTCECALVGSGGMKPREFARKYRLSDYAVYKGIREGSIPNVRVGNRFVVLVDKFEEKSGHESVS